MQPITRKEMYLNRLAGQQAQAIPAEPITREEQYLGRLCGENNVIPEEPRTRKEIYLANLCGEDVTPPAEAITRIEQYMAFASGESESKPEKPITREEMYWDKYQGGDVPEEKTIPFTDIITVTDALARPAVDLQSEITATQNLNGYEYPWVGGAGVNLLPKLQDGTYSGNGVTAVVKDGIATLSGTTTTSGNALIIPLDEAVTVPNQTCYVHWLNSDVNSGIAPSIELSTDIQNTGISASFASVNRISEVPSNRQGIAVDRCRFWLAADRTLSGTFAPMICLTSTATAYAPYENICPISGRTEVNVTRTGKNWYFSKTVDYTSLGVNLKTDGKGKFEVSGTSTGGWINPFSLRTNITLPVGTYTISASISGTMPEDDTVVGVERVSGTSINGYLRLSPTNPSGSLTFTVTEETVVTQGMYAPAGEFDAEITIQIELGSTATAYEPYEGDTFNTELGRTVYGGTLDLTTGELKITHAYVDLGDLTWTVANLNVFQTQISEKKVGSTNFITTSYRTVVGGYANLANGEATSISPMTHGHIYTYVGIKDERVTTGEEFKTLVTGQKMVYELATPQTISLTPTEVMMLENNNTIWADAGRVQLTYLSKAAQRVQSMNASLKANTLKITKAITGGVEA